MIYSMTGFGQGVASTSDKKITVEIKSLNSKQFDLATKLPHDFHEMEVWVRAMLSEQMRRGKIEVSARCETIFDGSASVFNTELLKAYKQQITLLGEELGIGEPQDWYCTLLRLPDVFKAASNELSDSEREAFIDATKEALRTIILFRLQEGEKLAKFFSEKISNIRALLAEVEQYEVERVTKIKARLQEQLEKISGVEYDHGRLEQELIYYIEKLDVNEEKQRLTAHLDYFLLTMDSDDDNGSSSKGKKLGFIAQEMGREINTLGSKSNNAEMQIIVVKMKDELEQIKEQVLNVL